MASVYVFRVLRPDEVSTWKTQGIKAKNPNSNHKVVQHVNGTLSTKFISTTATLKTATNFAGLAVKYNLKKGRNSGEPVIVKINLTKLKKENPNTIVTDLTLSNVLDEYLPQLEPGKQNKGMGYGRARQNATKYKEVLIVGLIPPDCIELVDYDISESEYDESDYSEE